MKSILKGINLFLYCIILLLLLTGKSYGQEYYRAIVRVSHSPVDITNLAKSIATQTGLEYSLNMQNASLKKQITLRAGTWQLADILKQVQEQAGLNYRIIGDHILFMDYQVSGKKNEVIKDKDVKKNATNLVVIINKRGYSQVVSRAVKNQKVVAVEEKRSAPVASKVTKAIANNGNAPIIGKANNQANKDRNSKNQVNKAHTKKDLANKGQTSKNQVNKDRNNKEETKKEQTRKESANKNEINKDQADNTPIISPGLMFNLPKDPIWTKATNLKDTSLLVLSKKLSPKKNNLFQPKDNTPAKADKEKNEWHKVFVKAGLSADEILYLNASLTAGIKYVYGIVSYGTTFSGNRLRFGLGVPIKLNNEQQLHFNATAGIKVNSNYVDSLPVSSAVHENLFRYGVAWSKTYKERWTLQVQVHYNVLKKTSDSTNPLSAYNHFYYANAPYVLSQNSGSHSETRTWIGAQIALFYKLF